MIYETEQQQINKQRQELCKKREQVIKDYGLKLVALCQKHTDYKLALYMCFESDIEIGFENERFISFSIRFDKNTSLISMSHGLYGYVSLDRRNLLIQLDILVGKLWGYEKELTQVFIDMAKDREPIEKEIRELDNRLQEIKIAQENERKSKLLNVAKSHRYFKKYGHTYYSIISIGEKIVKVAKTKQRTSDHTYFSGYNVSHIKLNQFLLDIERGEIELVNEIGEDYDWQRQW